MWRDVFLDDLFSFDPGNSYLETVELPEKYRDTRWKSSFFRQEGQILVSWATGTDRYEGIPKPAAVRREIPEPSRCNDQLYLTGLHLEQYRHATFDPRDYYLEALRRDPADSRCNNALGSWHLKRGMFAEAEGYFRKAICTITERNPNPIDGEPFYNLGLTLKFMERAGEAYDAFYKSVWNAAWMDNGYFQIARLEAANHRWQKALETIERSLIRNWHNHKARQLKVSVLRYLGKTSEALALTEESIALDRFNFSMYYEQYLLGKNTEPLQKMKELINGNLHTYIEFALDYAFAGMFAEAIEMIDTGLTGLDDPAGMPMALYYKAWVESKAGLQEQSTGTLRSAAMASPDFCFPNHTEAVPVLEWAEKQNRDDSRAPYYLGNFWYHVRNYDQAIACWERSRDGDRDFPTVHRNLALAYYNKKKDASSALKELQTAFALDKTDARLLMELDQLYKRLNYDPAERLEFLENFPDLLQERDDLYLERITLCNLTGQHAKAFRLLMARKFHPWEGGEGKVIAQYAWSLSASAREKMDEGKYSGALDLLRQATEYPENLGEGKLFRDQENDIHYWMGIVLDSLGETGKAKAFWTRAATGLREPSAAMFYNDQQPDTIYYQGLAFLRLGDKLQAEERFNTLISYGEKHLDDHIKFDYFAVSLPDLQIWDDDLDLRNRQLCHYLIALGKLGKGDKQGAAGSFRKVLDSDCAHQGVQRHLRDAGEF